MPASWPRAIRRLTASRLAASRSTASNSSKARRWQRDALFVRPVQRQIPLVASLGLTLDSAGFIQMTQPTLVTSIPGIYAAGDLITPAQGALIAAASGTFTAAMLNRSLATELALQGALA